MVKVVMKTTEEEAIILYSENFSTGVIHIISAYALAAKLYQG